MIIDIDGGWWDDIKLTIGHRVSRLLHLRSPDMLTSMFYSRVHQKRSNRKYIIHSWATMFLIVLHMVHIIDQSRKLEITKCQEMTL